MLSPFAKFTGFLWVLVVCAASVPAARAGSFRDHTHVSMEGAILDTPCSIEPESRDQVIEMGSTSLGLIARKGADKRVPFIIRLTGCVLQRSDPRLPDWQQVAIKFDGVSDGNDFAVRGAGNGVALQIADETGNVVHPGTRLSSVHLTQDDQTLRFTLQLVSNHKPLRQGAYFSVIHFRLNYF